MGSLVARWERTLPISIDPAASIWLSEIFLTR
jgi:hypothetical protein